MNKSKVIALGIFLFLFFVPFRLLFFTDEIVNGGKFVFLLLANVIGFMIAFGIGTNEPFNRKKNISQASPKDESQRYNKAA